MKQNLMPIVSPSNSPPLTSSLKYVDSRESATKSLTTVGDGGLALAEKRVTNFPPKASESNPSTFR